MFILEGRAPTAVFTDLEGCHVEERADLFCMALDGRPRPEGQIAAQHGTSFLLAAHVPESNQLPAEVVILGGEDSHT